MSKNKSAFNLFFNEQILKHIVDKRKIYPERNKSILGFLTYQSNWYLIQHVIVHIVLNNFGKF